MDPLFTFLVRLNAVAGLVGKLRYDGMRGILLELADAHSVSAAADLKLCNEDRPLDAVNRAASNVMMAWNLYRSKGAPSRGSWSGPPLEELREHHDSCIRTGLLAARLHKELGSNPQEIQTQFLTPVRDHLKNWLEIEAKLNDRVAVIPGYPADDGFVYQFSYDEEMRSSQKAARERISDEFKKSIELLS